MIVMITKQKITIYLKYQNIDNFARIASAKEKNILGDKDWALIENLIQDSSNEAYFHCIEFF